MMCQTQYVMSHQTHVMPMNAAAHWRSYVDGMAPCERPAAVHVTVVYPDGQVVERDLCRQCAEEWQAEVRALEQRRDIAALGIIHPKSVWTITPL